MKVTVLDSLPSHPLKRETVERLRAHDTVSGFIELQSREYALQNGGLERAVALVEETVVGLSFEDGVWQQTVLARDADDQDHLQEALGQLNIERERTRD